MGFDCPRTPHLVMALAPSGGSTTGANGASRKKTIDDITDDLNRAAGQANSVKRLKTWHDHVEHARSTPVNSQLNQVQRNLVNTCLAYSNAAVTPSQSEVASSAQAALCSVTPTSSAIIQSVLQQQQQGLPLPTTTTSAIVASTLASSSLWNSTMPTTSDTPTTIESIMMANALMMRGAGGSGGGGGGGGGGEAPPITTTSTTFNSNYFQPGGVASISSAPPTSSSLLFNQISNSMHLNNHHVQANSMMTPSPPPQSISSPPSTSTPPSASATPTPTSTDIDTNVTNVYRGLYPINEVKAYFKRRVVNGQRQYLCLWKNCNFSTWKYSQHISRHIFLKHIGINKELSCKQPNCNKVFKRPESLVQHMKNHQCGFGIDASTMKDPANICGVRNIKHYFTRTLDNDIYVYQCQYENCNFVTHNSGSIRRHVHNQHVCPFSSPNSATNNRRSNNLPRNSHTNNTNSSNLLSPPPSLLQHQQSDVMQDSETVQVEVQLIEDADAIYDPVNGQIKGREEGDEEDLLMKPMDFSQKHHRNSVSTVTAEEGEEDEELMLGNDDTPYSAGQMDIHSMMQPISDDEAEDDMRSETSGTDDGSGTGSGRHSRSNGLYSLKNYAGQYRKERTESGSEFVCNNCNAFRAKSQITLIRHFWSEGNKKDFYCEAEGCNRKFDNEFSRYKHRKFEHRQSPPPVPPTQMVLGDPSTVAQGTVPLPVTLSPDMANRQLMTYMMPQGVAGGATIPNTLPEHMQNELLQMLAQRFVQQQHQQQPQFSLPIEDSSQVQLSVMLHQAPFLQAIPMTQAPPGQTIQEENASEHPSLISLLTRPTPAQKDSSEPGLEVHSNSRKSGIFSLKKYGDQYEKLVDEDTGLTQYQCRMCPEYIVRTQVSMVKHLRNQHPELNGIHVESVINCNTTSSNNNNTHESGVLQQLEDVTIGNDANSHDLSFDAKQPSTSTGITHSPVQSTYGSSAPQTPDRKYKNRDKTGIYSLKKFQGYYKRTRSPECYHYWCTQCDTYRTKSQASMIRHIWGHFPQRFNCPNCGLHCDNEFALYKHRRSAHPELTSQHNRTKGGSKTKAEKAASAKVKAAQHRQQQQQTLQQQSQMLMIPPQELLQSINFNQIFNLSKETNDSSILMQSGSDSNSTHHHNQPEEVDEDGQVYDDEEEEEIEPEKVSRRSHAFKNNKYRVDTRAPPVEQQTSDDEDGPEEEEEADEEVMLVVEEESADHVDDDIENQGHTLINNDDGDDDSKNDDLNSKNSS